MNMSELESKVMSNGFPKELLLGPNQERKNYFKNKFFEHRILKEVLRNTIERIYQVKDESIISIYGPSGVGKSALCRRLYESLLLMAKDDGLAKIGTIPVCHIKTRAPASGKFSWPEYNRRLLEALQEPMIDSKIKYEDRVVETTGQRRFLVSTSSALRDLNGVVEKALKYREVAYLIIDEAQHFSKISKSVSLSNQLDAIKSIANVTDTLHILVGTYDLLYMLDLSGQVARRDLHVHFPRYQKDNKKDLMDFAKVVKEMWQNLPLEDIPENPIGNPDYFYNRTLGCVGILHDWLYRVLATALLRGEKTVTSDLLDETCLHPNQYKKLKEEAEEGESVERSLWQGSYGELVTNGGEEFITPKPEKETKVEKTKKRLDVGKRNPTRDKIGVHYEDVNKIG